jgi:hypothetical protein
MCKEWQIRDFLYDTKLVKLFVTYSSVVQKSAKSSAVNTGLADTCQPIHNVCSNTRQMDPGYGSPQTNNLVYIIGSGVTPISVSNAAEDYMHVNVCMIHQLKYIFT